MNNILGKYQFSIRSKFIFYMRILVSGEYTCVTPFNGTNTIRIQVHFRYYDETWTDQTWTGHILDRPNLDRTKPRQDISWTDQT